jgi:ParB family transcriptional regulator, chromosome partitioning protein
MSKILSNPRFLSSGLLEDISIFKIIHPERHIRSRNEPPQDLLARSIKQRGLLQPILVRTKEEFFEIVAGNRRYQACKILGWRKITCNVVELNDKEAFEVALVENLQRKSLSPTEEARAFKAYVSDFGWGGISDLSSKIGRSVSYITKRIQLLTLPPSVLESIMDSKLTPSIAEELLSIKDKDRQLQIANIISKSNMTMRGARRLVKERQEECDSFLSQVKYTDTLEEKQRAFDKTIVVLKLAMNRLAAVIADVEDDWMIYEILIEHKNMLNHQIDILIKQKKKLQW